MNTTEAKRMDRSALEAELRASGATIRGSSAKCPFHEDRHPSGSIYQDSDGVWRFKCHGGECGFCGDIFDIRARATGRNVADILKDENPQAQPKRRETVHKTLDDVRAVVAMAGHIESEHPYINPDTGRADLHVFRVRGAEGKKDYRQASPIPGGWVLRAPGKPWPLYRRVEMAEVNDVIVVEGEKCCDALAELGIHATTSPCGAGKAEYADWTPLASKRAYLWPDNDTVGRNHAKQVMAELDKLTPACDVRVIEPTDVDLDQEHDDVVDLIEQCRKVGIDPVDEIDRACAMAKTFTLSSGLRERIEDTISGKWADVIWPWSKLTQLSRALLPQTVTVLCGTPGAAKSFLLFIALLKWLMDGIAWACLALEEDRTYILQRILAILEQNIELLNPDWQRANPDLAREAYERHRVCLDRFGRRIWDAPVQAMTLDAVADWIRDRARDGCRVIAVDPVTASATTEKAWVADTRFVSNVKAIMRSHDASLLLVTHPRKGSKMVGLDDLAGGAVYQRLSQCVLWLERHAKLKKVFILGDGECGRFETEISNSLHICKARNGRGHGLSLGFKVDWPTLAFAEQGIVIKEKK